MGPLNAPLHIFLVLRFFPLKQPSTTFRLDNKYICFIHKVKLFISYNKNEKHFTLYETKKNYAGVWFFIIWSFILSIEMCVFFVFEKYLIYWHNIKLGV